MKNWSMQSGSLPRAEENLSDRWHHFSLISKEILNWLSVKFRFVCSRVKEDEGQMQSRCRADASDIVHMFSERLKALRKITLSHRKGVCKYCKMLLQLL